MKTDVVPPSIEEKEAEQIAELFDCVRYHKKPIYIRAGSGKERSIAKVEVMRDRIVLRG